MYVGEEEALGSVDKGGGDSDRVECRKECGARSVWSSDECVECSVDRVKVVECGSGDFFGGEGGEDRGESDES